MPEELTTLEGGCTCGKVRFRLLSKPMYTHCCHCTWCQRESGSAFAVNALIEADQVQVLQGETEIINIPTNSGKGQDVVRCSHCKIALWSNYCGMGNAINFVRVGTLETPDGCPPDIHIFTSTKQHWVQFSDNIPVVEEYYQRSKYWSEESVTRFKTAIGK